jgi:hypothetical protein
MRVIAVPSAAFPPAPRGLEAADVVLASIDELTVAAIDAR